MGCYITNKLQRSALERRKHNFVYDNVAMPPKNIKYHKPNPKGPGMETSTHFDLSILFSLVGTIKEWVD